MKHRHSHQNAESTSRQGKFKIIAVHSANRQNGRTVVAGLGDNLFDAIAAFVASIEKFGSPRQIGLLLLALQDAISTAEPDCHEFRFEHTGWHIFVYL